MRAALIGLGLVSVATAHAEPDPYVERQFAVSGHAGAGTPLGFLGVAASVAVHPRISVEAGIGKGLVGYQVAGQSRARVVPFGVGWLSLGAGFSGGHYEQREPSYGIEYNSIFVDRAYWANGEISFESRSADGFDFRVYAGAGVVVAGERTQCGDYDEDLMPCSGSARGMWAPYAGVSLGYAVPL